MDTELNRDKVWDQETWKTIDDAVKDGLQGLRTLQQIIVADMVPGAVNVPADKFNPEKMSMDEAPPKLFVELQVDFSLTPMQFANEKTLKTGATLSRFAAKTLALAEDMLFYQGTVPAKVHKRNEKSIDVILESAKLIEWEKEDKVSVSGEQVFSLVTQGIADLVKDGQPGPYAFVLHTGVYAAAYSPMPGSLVTAADRLTPMLKGGFYPAPSLPENTGLLVSLGGHPTSIYVAQDPIAGYCGQGNGDGSFLFCVKERIQIIVRDAGALRRLAFKATPAEAKKDG